MKTASFKSLTAILLLLTVCSCNSSQTVYAPVIKELDNTIARQGEIDAIKERKADSLRTIYFAAQDARSRFRAGKAMFDEYSRYDLDSALVYAHANMLLAAASQDRKMKFDAAMDIADRYIVSGMYQGALETIEELDTTGISKEDRFAYFHMKERLYHGLYLTEKDPERKAMHRKKSLYFGMCSPKMEMTRIDYLLNGVAYEIDNARPEKAREMIENYLASNNTSYSEKASLHYWIAKTYRAESNLDHQILHFAISANYDKLVPVKASRSLINLSRLLFEAGDTDHAFKYIITAYEDATRSDARIAMEEIDKFLPRIILSYEKIQHRSSRILSYLLFIMIAFTLTLSVVLIIIYADRNKIRKMQQKIHQNNIDISDMNLKLEERLIQLKESNQIKNIYIGRYMMMFSKHIDSLERYRSWLRVKAKSNDILQLQKALRMDEPIEEERKTLFDEFDETFLALFPNYIEQLNSLLEPQHRIGRNIKPNRLTSELRIFALIRLGVTDSASIAQFLKKSPSTIYNYRVKLRNASLCHRDDFENQLMQTVESL